MRRDSMKLEESYKKALADKLPKIRIYRRFYRRRFGVEFRKGVYNAKPQQTFIVYFYGDWSSSYSVFYGRFKTRPFLLTLLDEYLTAVM